jgi:uroporphyrinogen decarboxylase
MTAFNDRFLRACRRQPVDRTPIWLMRQAGRYQPEYRAMRREHSMMKICTTPELAAQVTRVPLERFDFDAAILFSDLTMPFTPMGAPFELRENEGPVLARPVRTEDDVDTLRIIEPALDLPFTLEAIRLLVPDLRVPLIGFTGAPFTLAAYLVEGRGSRDFRHTRSLMYARPGLWRRLMELLSENVARYLRAQIEAGASAVQLFDSWIGVVPPHVYRTHVMPHMRSIFEALAPLGAPVIHFGTGTSELLSLMREAGGDVIGVDWRTPLGEARERIGDGVAIQGNLDPTALAATPEVVRSEALRVMREAAGRAGHIFNLGHGVLPETPIGNVELLVDLVHAA